MSNQEFEDFLSRIGFVKMGNVLFYEHSKDLYMRIIGNDFSFERKYNCYFNVNGFKKSGRFDIDLEKSPIETFLAYIKFSVGDDGMVNIIKGIIRDKKIGEILE